MNSLTTELNTFEWNQAPVILRTATHDPHETEQCKQLQELNVDLTIQNISIALEYLTHPFEQ